MPLGNHASVPGCRAALTFTGTKGISLFATPTLVGERPWLAREQRNPLSTALVLVNVSTWLLSSIIFRALASRSAVVCLRWAVLIQQRLLFRCALLRSAQPHQDG